MSLEHLIMPGTQERVPMRIEEQARVDSTVKFETVGASGGIMTAHSVTKKVGTNEALFY